MNELSNIGSVVLDTMLKVKKECKFSGLQQQLITDNICFTLQERETEYEFQECGEGYTLYHEFKKINP